MLPNKLYKLCFKQSKTIFCLNIFPLSERFIILIYVDDLLIFISENDIDKLIQMLKKVLIITNLGRPSYFLMAKFHFRDDWVFLSLSNYVDKIIDISNIASAKPTKYSIPWRILFTRKSSSCLTKNNI